MIKPKASLLRKEQLKKLKCAYCWNEYDKGYSNTRCCSKDCHRSLYPTNKDTIHRCLYCDNKTRRLYCSEKCRKDLESTLIKKYKVLEPEW